MILVKSSTYFTVIHHALHFPIEGLVVYAVLQQLEEVLFVHEFLSFCHLFHYFKDGLADVEHASALAIVWVRRVLI